MVTSMFLEMAATRVSGKKKPRVHVTCAGTQSGANAPKSHRATDMRREPIVIRACAERSEKILTKVNIRTLQ